MALNSRKGTQFKASAQCHPSLLDLADGPKITIPMIILPSLDEEPHVSRTIFFILLMLHM
jgi:hypothetical protein